jgi:hypothetical protein
VAAIIWTDDVEADPAGWSTPLTRAPTPGARTAKTRPRKLWKQGTSRQPAGPHVPADLPLKQRRRITLTLLIGIDAGSETTQKTIEVIANP